jgi:hypothetical protein
VLVCSQLALAAIAAAVPPTTNAALATREPALEPIVQGTQGANPPKWFVSFSGNWVTGDIDGPLGSSSADTNAFGIDAGYTNWNDQLGITLEAGYMSSSAKIDISSIDTTNVDTKRYLIGLRLFDRGQGWWLPYFRGGYMYRTDSGDQIDDKGSGWYAGGGFDVYLGQNLRIGPQVIYTNSQSINAQEWIFGGVVSFGF